ncbi:MAG: amidohydrolase family protein [Verrucomicrobiaceae bacterium]|nr:amidohydrolase family protein [Verrucomicrobiaceae bacterium]
MITELLTVHNTRENLDLVDKHVGVLIKPHPRTLRWHLSIVEAPVGSILPNTDAAAQLSALRKASAQAGSGLRWLAEALVEGKGGTRVTHEAITEHAILTPPRADKKKGGHLVSVDTQHHGTRLEIEGTVSSDGKIVEADLAAQEKAIVGFCGHLEPDADFSKHLKRFAANPIFRGVRWSGMALSDPSKAQAIQASAHLLADHGLQLDVNGPATSLPALAKLAKEVPALRIVIDHLGAPGDPASLRPEWKPGILSVAKLPNVFMKVSALVEQVKCPEGQAPRDASYYLPVLDHLWESFGPDRLIYGSNWPVSDKGGSYDVVFGIVREYFGSKGSEACEKYFWKNSQGHLWKPPFPRQFIDREQP